MSKYFRITVCLIITNFCACSASESEPTQAGVRIVSLSPSITASIIDMGFGEKIVGRSAFCEEVSGPIPVVGDLYAVDYERLLRLQPTHVFMQHQVGGINSHLVELAGDGMFILKSWKLNTIENITELSVQERSKLFNRGTFYLACGMTIAQYEKMEKTNKVMFSREVVFSDLELD